MDPLPHLLQPLRTDLLLQRRKHLRQLPRRAPQQRDRRQRDRRDLDDRRRVRRIRLRAPALPALARDAAAVPLDLHDPADRARDPDVPDHGQTGPAQQQARADHRLLLVHHAVRAVDHGQLLPDDPPRARGRRADRRLHANRRVVPRDPATVAPGAPVNDAVRVPDRVGRVPLRPRVHLDERVENDPGGDRRVHGTLHDGLRAAGRRRHPRVAPAGSDRRRLPALHRRRSLGRSGEGMSAPSYRDGMLAQPANLLDAATPLRDALAATDLGALREGTIVFSGIGASWHALLPAVRHLRSTGRRAFAVPAPQLPGVRDLADAYVLISQSGRSVELLEAIEALPAERVYALSTRSDSPLAATAGAFLPLSPRQDSAVSTLSYTATLQALGMLAEELV